VKDTSAPKLVSMSVFADILQRFQWPLFGFLRSFIGDDEHSRDLVQDVFCDALRAASQAAPPFDGQGDIEYIRRWLFHTAYCRAVSALRRRRLIRWDSLDLLRDHEQESGTPLLTLPFEDTVLEATVLRATLAAMTSQSVALLLLSIVYGFTTMEIADIVGLSHDATRKRLTRAKQRLRSEYLARNPLTQEASHP
jgi:RNA polymerase sigma-70 factor (ECF subfamily)